MKLAPPTPLDFREMMTWFSSEDELREWAGPEFRYPYDFDSFVEDLKLDTLNSYSLVSDEPALIGFGQYYRRLGRCHLGRLVVSPAFRGRGMAARLIDELSRHGLRRLEANSCSLFVLERNRAAISAYRKSGFEVAPYPEDIGLEACFYMVKDCGEPV